MPSVHQQIPVSISRDIDPPGQHHAGKLSLHFSDARPMEVRLRLPLADLVPDLPTDTLRRYACWPFERAMLKGSIGVIGPVFGMGDVRCSTAMNGTWLCQLSRGSRSVLLRTDPLWFHRFFHDVDRLAPYTTDVDVDGLIADLLGAGS